MTTRSHIFYMSDNVDDRRHVLEKTAGSFSLSDLPPITARLLHLVRDHRIEFPLDFMVSLRRRGFDFSIDMQALIRTADPETGNVTYGDYPHKQQVATMAEKIKLDVVEAELLTGTSDLEQAAIQFEKWGRCQTMVTRADGALVRHAGEVFRTLFEPGRGGEDRARRHHLWIVSTTAHGLRRGRFPQVRRRSHVDRGGTSGCG